MIVEFWNGILPKMLKCIMCLTEFKKINGFFIIKEEIFCKLLSVIYFLNYILFEKVFIF